MINQIWNPEVFRSKGFNFFSLCHGIYENVFHFFTLMCCKPPNSFGILQPLSNKTNRNTTTVPAERNSSKRPITIAKLQTMKKEYSWKRQTKGIIYLASVLNNVWKVLSKDCSFCPDLLTKMATIGNSCFWLANFFKSSPLKPLDQINRNLVGSVYGRSSIKVAHLFPIR